MTREVSMVEDESLSITIFPIAKRSKGSGPPSDRLHELRAPQSNVYVQQSAAKPVSGQDNIDYGRSRGSGIFRGRGNFRPRGRNPQVQSNYHWDAHNQHL